MRWRYGRGRWFRALGRRGGRGCSFTASVDEGKQVALGDPAADAGAWHLGDVDAVLLGGAADDGGGADTQQGHLVGDLPSLANVAPNGWGGVRGVAIRGDRCLGGDRFRRRAVGAYSSILIHLFDAAEVGADGDGGAGFDEDFHQGTGDRGGELG